MHPCRLLRYDSFKSLRHDLSPLFSPLMSPESLRHAMHRHLCHAPHRFRHRPQQRRSWTRSGLTLLLEEARRRGNSTVARTALEVALRDPQITMEPHWAKNALATCRTQEELRAMETFLLTPSDKNHRIHEHESVSGDDAGESLPALLNEAYDDKAVLEPAGYSFNALSALSRMRGGALAAPNASFTRYFVRQGLVTSETELMELVEAMRGRPPVGFRVHMSQMYGKAIYGMLRDRVGITPLDWMPSSCGAFTMADTPDTPHSALLANRQVLRALAHERLIAFQSTSSMLPVLFLDPQPGEAVLDLCAAPGSKTAMILDYMTASSPNSTCSSTLGSCVVANESHAARGHALAHRLENMSPSVGVTHQRGESFAIQSIAAGGVRYEKVLVDAPCSGEGRMGRDPVSWHMWHPMRALNFVPTQMAILRQAVALCAAGGRVVYATCSLNPLENEAVVAAVLAEGCVELLRPPKPRGWRFARGLRHWLVPSQAGELLRCVAEAKARGERADPVLFPPEDREDILAAIASCCVRVLPHQNGGAEGFFLAVLRKLPHSATVTSSHLLPSVSGGGGLDASMQSRSSPPVFSSGSLTLESVAHAYGAVRLAAGNALLRQHLAGFFGDSPPTMEATLARHGLCAVWRERSGLFLVSQRTWEQLLAIPTTSINSSLSPSSARRGSEHAASLLGLGVLAFDAATGALTESGAHLLRPHATTRLLRLPRSEFQSLLANRSLRVEAQREDPAIFARRLLSGAHSTGRATPLAWVQHLLHEVGRRDGPFIVTCVPPNKSQHAHAGRCGSPTASEEDAVMGVLTTALCVPVMVRRRVCAAAAVELHLSLSQEARQRCMAVVGRGIAHTRRGSAAGVERQHLAGAARFHTSAGMSCMDLEGTPMTASRQHQQLFPHDTHRLAHAGSEGGDLEKRSYTLSQRSEGFFEV